MDISRNWSNLLQQNGKLYAFIGGQAGMPRGLMYPNKLNFAPRVGIAHHFESSGMVLRAAYGIFYTPVDMNTAQYIQQWTASLEKSLGRNTTLEVVYHGEHGLHLQRSHLINNADPGPGRCSRAGVR